MRLQNSWHITVTGQHIYNHPISLSRNQSSLDHRFLLMFIKIQQCTDLPAFAKEQNQKLSDVIGMKEGIMAGCTWVSESGYDTRLAEDFSAVRPTEPNSEETLKQDWYIPRKQDGKFRETVSEPGGVDQQLLLMRHTKDKAEIQGEHQQGGGSLGGQVTQILR